MWIENISYWKTIIERLFWGSGNRVLLKIIKTVIQTRFVQVKQKESACRRIGCFIYVSQLVKCSQTIHQVAGSFTSAPTSFQPGEKLILKISFFLALQVSLKDVRKISTCPRWKTSTKMHGKNLTCKTNQRTIEGDFYWVLT